MKDNAPYSSVGSSDHRITESSPSPRRYSIFPKALAKSVEQVVKPVYKKHGFAEHRILTQWDTIVGEELAACSVPQKLVCRKKNEGGTLHVLVAGGRALELQHMQPVILDKIATYFGYAAVARLAFMQSAAPFLRQQKEPEILPRPADNNDVAAVVAVCDDEALRRALLSLGSTLAAKDFHS